MKPSWSGRVAGRGQVVAGAVSSAPRRAQDSFRARLHAYQGDASSPTSTARRESLCHGWGMGAATLEGAISSFPCSVLPGLAHSPGLSSWLRFVLLLKPDSFDFCLAAREHEVFDSCFGHYSSLNAVVVLCYCQSRSY